MRRPDLHADDHFAAVGGEVFEDGPIRDGNAIGFVSTSGDARKRRSIRRRSRLRAPVRELPELSDQDQRPACNEHDQRVQRQQLAAIRSSAHCSPPLNRPVGGEAIPEAR
jgi:hypothetical protein